MKTPILAAAAVLATFASLVACSVADKEDVGSNDSNITDDVDHMFKRPNGNYDVFCKDGHTDDDVPTAAILANNVCPYDATVGTSSSSGTSGNASSSGGTSGNASSTSSSSGNASSTSSSSGNASSSGGTSGNASSTSSSSGNTSSSGGTSGNTSSSSSSGGTSGNTSSSSSSGNASSSGATP